MEVLGGWAFLRSEVPLYPTPFVRRAYPHAIPEVALTTAQPSLAPDPSSCRALPCQLIRESRPPCKEVAIPCPCPSARPSSTNKAAGE
ncbi:hypothetical protein T484DRAFT_2833064 [Baffinella frigidus]|nr:hypothetical protein T484DRAFT_2833064 [Cryptophyta sp. CCMP2293]